MTPLHETSSSRRDRCPIFKDSRIQCTAVTITEHLEPNLISLLAFPMYWRLSQLQAPQRFCCCLSSHKASDQIIETMFFCFERFEPCSMEPNFCSQRFIINIHRMKLLRYFIQSWAGLVDGREVIVLVKDIRRNALKMDLTSIWVALRQLLFRSNTRRGRKDGRSFMERRWKTWPSLYRAKKIWSWWRVDDISTWAKRRRTQKESYFRTGVGLSPIKM